MKRRNLLRDRRGPGCHQLGETSIFAQTREIRILIDVVDSLVAFLHGAPQVLQGAIGIALLGIKLGDHVVKAGPVLGRRQLGGDSVTRRAFKNIGIELQGALA